MALKPLQVLTLWATVMTLASAADISLSSDTTDFITPCARSCLQSFVTSNFDVSACGEQPTLQCLCRQTGGNGYTIGEGAIQCIAGGTASGTCDEEEQDEASKTAYNMCVGVAGAAPQTHSTIVATVSIPSATAPTTLPTTSSSPQSAEVGPTRTTTGSTSTATAGSDKQSSDQKANSVPFSTAAIVGIVLGGVAILSLVVVLIFLLRQSRRKRWGDEESDIVRINDPKNRSEYPDSHSLKMADSNRPARRFSGFFKTKEPKARPGRSSLQISSPIFKTPVQMDFQFARPGDAPVNMLRPETIGLAVSPDPTAVASPETQHTRHQHRFQESSMILASQPAPETPTASQPVPSPARPTLMLAIPGKEPQPQLAPPPPLAGAGITNERDSIITEFAEDGEPESTIPVQVWRPPRNDAQATPPLYVAERPGAWVLREKTRKPRPVEMPSPTDKTKAERALGEVQVEGLAELAATHIMPPPSTTAPADLTSRPQYHPRTSRVASSVYSANFGMPSTSQAADRQPSIVLDKRRGNARNGTTGTGAYNKSSRRSLRRSRRPERRRSTDSATTIEEGFSDGEADNMTNQAPLTPVMEAPNGKGGGRSPVSYPKIEPRDREARPPLSIFPPQAPVENISTPARAILSRSPNYQSSSPGPGSSIGGKSPLVGTAMEVKYIAHRPAGNHPSSPLMGITGAKATQYQEREQLRSQAAIRPTSVLHTPPSTASPRPDRQHRQPPVQSVTRQDWNKLSPVSPGAQSHLPNKPLPPPPEAQRSRRPPHATQQQQSNAPSHVANMVSNSLLARRLGKDRAAEFSLDEVESKKRSDKWKRDEQDLLQQELPLTAGWQPRLTPTRRGADLVLSVR